MIKITWYIWMVQSGLNKLSGDDSALSCCQLDFKGRRSVRPLPSWVCSPNFNMYPTQISHSYHENRTCYAMEVWQLTFTVWISSGDLQYILFRGSNPFIATLPKVSGLQLDYGVLRGHFSVYTKLFIYILTMSASDSPSYIDGRNSFAYSTAVSVLCVHCWSKAFS